MSVPASRTPSHASGTGSVSGAAPRLRRPTEFRLLDGRRVLVALPEDVHHLRSKYASPGAAAAADNAGGRKASNSSGSSDMAAAGDASPPVAAPAGMQVEVVVHGSAEHEALLREALAQHQARREHLRATHGDELLDEWDSVGRQLDAASAMLSELEARGGAGSGEGNNLSSDIEDRLKHNFGRFGYTANIMVRDDSGGASGSRTPATSGNGISRAGSVTADPEKPSGAISTAESGGRGEFMDKSAGTTMKLFKRPVVKQYFHKGLLWRFSEETKVMSFELFFDLLYVGIIAVNGDHVSEDPTGRELLRFVVTFIMSWKIWSDVGQLVSWFETDDVVQRVEILFLIACQLGLTTNMLQTFNDTYDTYLQLVAFYLAARLFVAAYCGLTAALVPMVAGTMASLILLILLSSALWIGSIHVDMPNRLALTFIALAIDIFGQTGIVGLYRYSRRGGSRLADRIGKVYEFYPAINIEHRVERTNAFVGLVFGYSVVGLIYQNAAYGINAFLGKAVLGLVQVFTFNWLYFEIDGQNLHLHAIRRSPETTFVWQTAHIPFICAYVLGGAALSRLVVAHDSPNSPVDSLTHFYEERSHDHIDDGLRWFYGGGMGITLACMAAIAWSHHHKHPPTQYLSKTLRLANRLAIAIVFVCLPLAHDLDSLELIGVGCSLTVWVLMVEIFGKSCRDDPFFGASSDDPGSCPGYLAHCDRRDLENAIVKADGDVDVYELDRREKTAVLDVGT